MASLKSIAAIWAVMAAVPGVDQMLKKPDIAWTGTKAAEMAGIAQRLNVHSVHAQNEVNRYISEMQTAGITPNRAIIETNKLLHDIVNESDPFARLDLRGSRDEVAQHNHVCHLGSNAIEQAVLTTFADTVINPVMRVFGQDLYY